MLCLVWGDDCLAIPSQLVFEVTRAVLGGGILAPHSFFRIAQKQRRAAAVFYIPTLSDIPSANFLEI